MFSTSVLGVPLQPTQLCAPFALNATLAVVAATAPAWSLPSTEVVVPPARLPTLKLSLSASIKATAPLLPLLAVLVSLLALVVFGIAAQLSAAIVFFWLRRPLARPAGGG